MEYNIKTIYTWCNLKRKRQWYANFRQEPMFNIGQNLFFPTFNFCVLFQTKPSAHIVASYLKSVGYSTNAGIRYFRILRFLVKSCSPQTWHLISFLPSMASSLRAISIPTRQTRQVLSMLPSMFFFHYGWFQSRNDACLGIKLLNFWRICWWSDDNI